MNCIKCSRDLRREELIEMSNRAYVEEGIPIGSFICYECHAQLPEMVFVVNKDTGNQRWIRKSELALPYELVVKE